MSLDWRVGKDSIGTLPRLCLDHEVGLPDYGVSDIPDGARDAPGVVCRISVSILVMYILLRATTASALRDTHLPRIAFLESPKHPSYRSSRHQGLGHSNPIANS